MILKAMAVALVARKMVRCAIRASFTAGAVAGTAGVIGLCAARRAMAQRKGAESTPPAAG
jgi:hypothetical protein